jgi:hypothetical protein
MWPYSDYYPDSEPFCMFQYLDDHSRVKSTEASNTVVLSLSESRAIINDLDVDVILHGFMLQIIYTIQKNKHIEINNT